MIGVFRFSACSSRLTPLARGRSEFRGRRDRGFRAVIGFHAPDGVFLQVADPDRRNGHAEEVGGEGLDVADGYPRRAEVGVDVAGQHVLRLNCTQGLGVSGIGRSGPAGCGQLLPHVAR